MAEQMGVVFLGRIPMEISARETADAGKPLVLAEKESAAARAFGLIAENVIKLAALK